MFTTSRRQTDINGLVSEICQMHTLSCIIQIFNTKAYISIAWCKNTLYCYFQRNKSFKTDFDRRSSSSLDTTCSLYLARLPSIDFVVLICFWLDDVYVLWFTTYPRIWHRFYTLPSCFTLSALSWRRNFGEILVPTKAILWVSISYVPIAMASKFSITAG